MIFAERMTVLRPKRLKEALSMLRDEGPLIPLAGATDLYVTLNAGQLPAQPRYLDIWGLSELRGITRKGRNLHFGALVTFSNCQADDDARSLLPALAQAAAQVGGVQIQNRGTLAGNIANASPAADAVPVLMAADASVVLASARDGEREVPLRSFYRGYRQTARGLEELIVGIRVRVARGPQAFHKVGTRAAQAISKVVMARVGTGVAWGSVAPTVVRAPQLEAYLAAGGGDAAEAERLALAEVAPIDDVRSTASYRRQVVANLARTLV